MIQSFSDLALIGVSLSFVYLIGLSIWRLFLSPISNVPGPKLAALTFWYEFYYDVVRGGEYVFKIRELHQQYGPIIRINPYEVHIGDPHFHSELFRPLTKGKTNKWDWALGNLGNGESGLATVEHDIHRKRRGGYQSYFSRGSLLAMEPNMHPVIQKGIARIAECQSQNKAVNIEHIYAAIGCDFIHEYCFQTTLDICSRPDMGRQLYDANMTISRNGPLLRHLPWMEKVMGSLPTSARMKLNPSLAIMIELKKSFVGVVQEAVSGRGTEDEKKLGYSQKQTLMNHLLDSDMPPPEKSFDRLRDEAQTMSLAGTLATSQAASYALFHILMNPEVKARLLFDIKAAAQSTPDSELLDLKTLEAIPYLTAVIYETLRYTYGTTNRHTRIRPDENTVFTTKAKTYVLPAGTPVSMSGPTTTRDPDLWPEPFAYNPDRFLPLETKGHHLWQHVGSFNGGTRLCAGMNLALIELHLLLGETLRRFGDSMKVAACVGGKEDMEILRDYIIGRPKNLKAQIWVDWIGSESSQA